MDTEIAMEIVIWRGSGSGSVSLTATWMDAVTEMGDDIATGTASTVETSMSLVITIHLRDTHHQETVL
jgi:hypothetical protein